MAIYLEAATDHVCLGHEGLTLIPKGFDQLDPKAATLFMNFVSLPAQTLHSDWRMLLIPDWVADTPLSHDWAALSTSLVASLELTADLSEFDVENLVHRAALMPPEGLLGLARHLGLGLHASDFLRVIERDKISALDHVLTTDDWQMLLKLPRQNWPGEPLAGHDLSLIAVQFSEDGIACLNEIFNQQPRDIGQRALLKLPRSQCQPDRALVARSLDLFPSVYQSFIAHWNPPWRDLWATDAQDSVH